MKEIFDSIRQAFALQGEIAEISPLTGGSIHRTYKIRLNSGKIYIFQKMHTGVFQKPEAVMQNILKVTAYLNQNYPDRQTLHFYQTYSGAYIYQNWRVSDYIPAQSLKLCENLYQTEKAGAMFGWFQKAVSGMNADSLYPVIPEFHDTKAYFQKLLQFHADMPEIEKLKNWQEQACFVCDVYQKDRISLKVTHNDMKCSNLLFDSSGMPVAVIDLDTVMSGKSVYDFGDAVRSFASNVSSSEPDFSKIGLNMQKFKAFASGWLSQAEYAAEERKLLLPAVFSVTVELAVRYLTDYLQGNVYFKTEYPEQNLVKARNQIKLAQEILNHQAEMKKILRI